MTENKYNSDYPQDNYNGKDFGCSNFDREPATGKYKEFLLLISRMSSELPGLGGPDANPCSIAAGHSLLDVRCNGRLRRASLSRLLRDLTGYKRGLDTLSKRIEAAIPKADEAIRTMLDSYEVCPKCEGHCGERLGPNSWEDCEECDGFGMIEVKDK